MPIFPALLQFLRSEGKIRDEVRRKQKKERENRITGEEQHVPWISRELEKFTTSIVVE